ncbi:MAG: AraC family transcriptional regulator [Bacteroidetes bacterium]|nr:AraC family transcriptional regulator [Bacteroidota bacterium]MCW5895599.1 AraC family transcriptional regulator [Bacteroidota bacterium]
MIFHTVVPKPPLETFIERFIYYTDYQPDHAIDRFLPDGNVEIIIDLTETPKSIYDNLTLKEIQICKGCWASGVRTEPISIPSGKDSAMFIIAFKKGMAFPFFPLPMNEVSNHVVQADILWKDFFADLRDALLAESVPARRFAVAATFLERQFHSRLNVNPCVAYAVGRIVENPSQISMNILTQEIGYSQKHFIQMFKQAVGVAPKAYLTIMRFQRVIQEIERRRNIDWSQLALDTGYYDQAHFIHDFKRFSGFTPDEYMARKNGQLNYVPVR